MGSVSRAVVVALVNACEGCMPNARLQARFLTWCGCRRTYRDTLSGRPERLYIESQLLPGQLQPRLTD
eukprot:287031-Pyramimonas_sp.AAC.1